MTTGSSAARRWAWATVELAVRTRFGVLVSTAAIGLLLWWAGVAPWWTARPRGGVHSVDVGIAAMQGRTFLVPAAAACGAYALAVAELEGGPEGCADGHEDGSQDGAPR